MPVRYRRATPDDIPCVAPLLSPDRVVFSEQTWAALPGVLAELIRYERMLLCVVENTDTGKLMFAGGSGFVDPGFLREAAGADTPVLEQAMSAEARSCAVFFDCHRLADANRRSDVHTLSFFGVPPQFGWSADQLAIGLSTFTAAWHFFHYGFRMREIFCECSHQGQAQIIMNAGVSMYRELPVPDGTVWQLRITREEAMKTPAAWPASDLLAPPPRLGFTRKQQQLLELALLDCSDREVAEQRELTPDAVKKRWRSIHAKVAAAEPHLFKDCRNGADQRRALLLRLRQNLEELRPF